MKSKHITETLDQTTFAELSKDELAAINEHNADCPSCRQSFEAARISSILLKVQSANVDEIAPSPFFQAKVMNALREKQNLRNPIEAFRRWWQASAVPVFMMVLTVAVLISLTVMAPQSNASDSTAELSSFNLYSTDAVILNQNAPRDLTNEQVFQVIYETKSDSGK
jgi:predicted anti-sigma-YlaC factor YlaD